MSVNFFFTDVALFSVYSVELIQPITKSSDSNDSNASFGFRTELVQHYAQVYIVSMIYFRLSAE